VTRLYYLPTDDAMNTYRQALSGERIGWVIFKHPSSFSPVHSVQFDPESGPVIVIYDEVWEVDPETDDVFATEDAARDKYWEQKS
jgi:hypothetical protein